MPKIKIIESDNTQVAQLSPLANVVYIPGKVKTGADKGEEPKLFMSLAELNNYNIKVEGTSTTELHYDTTTLSYKLMYRLLEYGLYVLYEGVIVGDDGAPEQIDWNRLADKSTYDIRYLTMGGFSMIQDNNATYGSMEGCAAKRGDCVALLDHPSELPGVYEYTLIATEPEDWSTNWTSKYKGQVYTKEGNDYTPVDDETAPEFAQNTYYTREEVSDKVDLIRNYFEQHKGTDATYSAAFTPSIITVDSLFKYKVGETEKYYEIPASFGYLFAYAKAIRNNPEWYAMAGSFRGTITELSDVSIHFSNEQVERLQGRAKANEVDLDAIGDNVGCAINTISYVRPYGYVVWGNRTFRENTQAEGTVALSFLNVRCLVNIIKKKMYDAARLYAFEPNNDVLWANFKSQIVPILEKMMGGNGIEGYKFTRLATNKKARLKARLTIVPVEAVEDFDLEVELANSLEVTE